MRRLRGERGDAARLDVLFASDFATAPTSASRARVSAVGDDVAVAFAGARVEESGVCGEDAVCRRRRLAHRRPETAGAAEAADDDVVGSASAIDVITTTTTTSTTAASATTGITFTTAIPATTTDAS